MGASGGPGRRERGLMPTGSPIRRLRCEVDPALIAVLEELTPVVYSSSPPESVDIPHHGRAASAIRRSGGRLVIVQDDVNVLAFHRHGAETEAVLLPPGEGGVRTFGEDRGNKHAKMDLEACAVLPDDRLVAFGSGSTPARERLVVVGKAGSPRVVEAHDLYRMLRSDTSFSGSELNVEGAIVIDDVVRFFQRGNGAPTADLDPVNATGDLDLSGFIGWLEGTSAVPSLRNVVQYDLGRIADVPFTFTDGAVMADGRVAFLACAEASPDTYRDGPVHGCRLGMLAGCDVRMAEIRHPDGRRALLKLEGLEAIPGEAGSFHVVADGDDPREPALWGRLLVRE